MIDTKYIGMALPAFNAIAEPNQLRFFAKAIGETNPILTVPKTSSELMPRWNRVS